MLTTKIQIVIHLAMLAVNTFNMNLKQLNNYMTLRDLYQYCVEMSEKHPQHAEQIKDFYDLAEMEVEDGGSVEHECELAYSDIEELVK